MLRVGVAKSAERVGYEVVEFEETVVVVVLVYVGFCPSAARMYAPRRGATVVDVILGVRLTADRFPCDAGNFMLIYSNKEQSAATTHKLRILRARLLRRLGLRHWNTSWLQVLQGRTRNIQRIEPLMTAREYPETEGWETESGKRDRK